MRAKNGDFVVLLDSGEVAKVLSHEDSEYTVLSMGAEKILYEEEFVVLNSRQVEQIGKATTNTAFVVDFYHDSYEAVKDEDGQIIYSSTAGAVLRALQYPFLIVALDDATNRVVELSREIAALRGENG